jgi:hypothetical protein
LRRGAANACIATDSISSICCIMGTFYCNLLRYWTVDSSSSQNLGGCSRRDKRSHASAWAAGPLEGRSRKTKLIVWENISPVLDPLGVTWPQKYSAPAKRARSDFKTGTSDSMSLSCI